MSLPLYTEYIHVLCSVNRRKAPCTASNGGRRIFQSITNASTVQVCSAIIGQIAVVRLNPLYDVRIILMVMMVIMESLVQVQGRARAD